MGNFITYLLKRVVHLQSARNSAKLHTETALALVLAATKAESPA